MLTLAGCKKKQQDQPDMTISGGKTTEASTEKQKETETETPSQNDLPEGYTYSYLTGEPYPQEEAEVRPVAVMFNNVTQALPQYGIGDASVIYEAPAEGGINRLMGIFHMNDATELERIGSTRSTRMYFVYFAAEFHAFLVHFGQASNALPYMNTIFCDNLNALENSGNGVFFRTNDRPSPHNAYASGQGIAAGISNMQYNPYYTYFDGSYPYSGTFRFNHDKEEVALENGMDASVVRPGYPINEPWFEYDPATGSYLRYQYGAPHVDADGEQLSVKNILICSMPCEHYYDSSYLMFHVQDGGNGFYITNGKAIPVTWEKDWEWGVTHYYDENGQEISLNPGKTWVCVVQQSLEGNIQITGSEE